MSAAGRRGGGAAGAGAAGGGAAGAGTAGAGTAGAGTAGGGAAGGGTAGAGTAGGGAAGGPIASRGGGSGGSATGSRTTSRRFGRAQGFPVIGPTVPAALLTTLTACVGLAASWFVIGLSGWLVIALLLVLGAAAVPRGPFAAILSVLLAAALVIDGFDGYTGRFVLLLAAVHLLLVVGSLSAWLPLRAHVQLTLLRAPLLRYLAVQVVAQAVSFVVVTFVAPAGGAGPGAGAVWLGIVGAAAALALALVVLVPALLRPAR
ncbi:hypothetical protein GCM10025867_02610 [Frondihabitans sucicola]|uniref:Rod shape-determining protein MreD n=1 Tax=Frondihabitans sucicola TaxID=1268041 RepID=A0ABN6XWH7_9MICO|nr:hypothetical protein [Frondihabitans sucicola]BDZ48020.1 hypothetical protein GCM10025867_02610 [Frondihabitans sucicola]